MKDGRGKKKVYLELKNSMIFPGTTPGIYQSLYSCGTVLKALRLSRNMSYWVKQSYYPHTIHVWYVYEWLISYGK